MTKNKRAGRPPSNLPTREKQVALFLTEADADWFRDFSTDFGFKSRAELLTAIAEGFRLCGGSPIGLARLGFQIGKRCKEVNPERYRQGGFDFASLTLRPLPVLPVDDSDLLANLDELDSLTHGVRRHAMS